MEVSIAGQTAVIVGYDSTVLEQDVVAEISASVLQNLWDATRDIDDGQGGTRSVQRYALGTYVDVYIRLVPGRGQTPVFFRALDVLVIDSAVVDQVARQQIAAIPSRFETTVGASPATLPTGTYELSVLGVPGNNSQVDHVAQRILLSDVPAADRDFFFRGDAANEFKVRMRYAAAGRTLTYAAVTTGDLAGRIIAIKAIGEA